MVCRTSDGPGQAEKQPYFIHPADGGVLAMAGLYEFWRDPGRAPTTTRSRGWCTCTVITTDGRGRAGPDPRPDADADRAGPLGGLARPELTDPEQARRLLVPAAPGTADALYPVSTAVNNVRNNGPELIEPLQGAAAVEAAETRQALRSRRRRSDSAP